MITIQGFAKLCGCNAQTLRYYDRIGLLAPARVDQWTGYRYYEENQARQFVKIKNLQQADFSIEEIRSLLKEDEVFLAEAFERKIREKEQELEKIRNISRSYLEEAMVMEKMLKAMTGYVEKRLDNPELWKEFGLDRNESAEVTARANELLAEWLGMCRNDNEGISLNADGQQIDGMMNVVEQLMSGKLDEAENIRLNRAGNETGDDIPKDAETIFARDGWEHIHEWIDEIPDLEKGREKYFLFRVRPDSPVSDHGFPTLVLAVMAARFDALEGGMSCKILLSDDGQNHFELRQR